MKFIKPLTEAEQITLQEAHRQGPTPRVRQRAQALLLSAQGMRIPYLVEVLGVDRDTLSRWFDDWEEQGLRGLYDAPRPGRPPILSLAEQQRVVEWVEDEPRRLRLAQVQISQETGKAVSLRALTRVMKKTKMAN